MDLETLKAIIDRLGGDNHVAALIFNNAGRRVFKKGEFNLTSLMTVPDKEVLEFVETDMLGNQIRVLKPIVTIEAVIGVDDPNTIDKLDGRYLAS